MILPTAPTIANAAVTKTYADTKLALTGGTVTGETSFNNKLSARQGTNAAQSFPISLGWSNAASTHWNMVLETNGSLTFANYNPANGAWKSSPITLNADGAGLSVSGNVAATGVVKASGATLHVDGNVQGTLWGGYLSDYINSRISSNTNGNMAGRAYPRRSDGAALNFMWQGQSGQPTWLWGGNGAGNDMYVYDPRNFSVNYANSTWNSERLQGWDIAGIQNDAQNRANDRGYWGTRDYLNAANVPPGVIVYRAHGNISGGYGDVRSLGLNGLMDGGSYMAMSTFQNGGTINWKRVG